MTCIDCIHSDVCFKNGTTPYWGARIACNSVEDLCDNFKSKADYMEVKHGYWKDRYGNKYDNPLYECSVCGEKALYKFEVDELGQEKAVQDLSLGCPHCLAKMDKGK